MTFLTSALSFILAPFIAAGVLLSTALTPAPQEPVLGATEAVPTVIAFFETTLASAITSDATTFTLTSATDEDGTVLATSTYAFVIDEGSSNEEIVIADCVATACTEAIRGVSVLTGTSSVAALKKSHRRGASVKITDAPILMILTRIVRGIQDVPNTITYDGAETIATTSNDIVYASWVNSNYGDLFNGNTFSGTQYFTGALFGSSTAHFTGTTTHYAGALVGAFGQCTTASPNTQLCDKAYVDGVAVAGASDANETTKGIVEEATAAEIAARTETGDTGAKLFITPSKVGALFTIGAGAYAGTYTSGATTTFTINAADSYMVYAGGTCVRSTVGSTQSDVYLYVDNHLVRQSSVLLTDTDGVNLGESWFFTYASSTPGQTTVDVRVDTSNCDSNSNVSFDWLIIP